MPRYCLDTSGLSNPILEMPEDIHVSLWREVRRVIRLGAFCWNAEIASQLESIEGELGELLKSCNDTMCYEVGVGNWPWDEYLDHVERMRQQYKQYISEYNGNRKMTVDLNDVSIICLGKTLNLPVVSMETPNRGQQSEKKLRIPDLCVRERVLHYNFTEFLRAEGISV